MNKKSLFIIGTVLAVALMLPGMFVMAQDGLDSSQNPNYGLYEIQFYPDPIITTMLSGGDVNISSLGVGEGCTGNATSNPDVKIEVADSGTDLRVFYATDQGDTTLAVELPDGSFVCNDDSDGLNPMVELTGIDAGTYSLWVGSFGADEFIPGYLVVTTGDSVPGAINAPVLGSVSGGTTPPDNGPSATATPSGGSIAPSNSDELNPAGEPTYGTSTLSAGFTPDPTEIEISSGGAVDITALSLGSDCRGFAASNPDHRVEFSGSSDLLRIFFNSDGDTTIVVRDPSGNFICNDDFDGLDPLVDFENPDAGTYDIWVGTFGSDEFIPGTLFITESDTLDPTNS